MAIYDCIDLFNGRLKVNRRTIEGATKPAEKK